MASTRSTYNQLPKTAQTVSIVSGDDGDLEIGSAISPRFIDNSDGTITDRVTNLMWVKNVSKLIPGATGVTSNNLINSDAGAWANSTSYSKGNFVHDPENSTTGHYICAADHTSGSAIPQGNWAYGYSYSINDKVRDTTAIPYTYWNCDTAHTSYDYADFTYIDWSTAFSLNQLMSGDDGKYRWCTSAHTTVSYPSNVPEYQTVTVGSYYSDYITGEYPYGVCTVEHETPSTSGGWSSYTSYYNGQIVYYDGGFWGCTQDHFSSGDFYFDQSYGLWFHIAETFFLLDNAIQGYSVWSIYNSIAEVDNAVNGGWSAGYTQRSAIERAYQPTWWSAATDNYSFAYNRSQNPTYWRPTVWIYTNHDINYASSKSFSDSITKCNDLEFAGYDDWRAPNIFEIISIMDWSVNKPIDTTFFDMPTSQNTFWSGTNQPHTNTLNSIYAGFGSTYGSMTSTGKTGTFAVRPVRSIK